MMGECGEADTNKYGYITQVRIYNTSTDIYPLQLLTCHIYVTAALLLRYYSFTVALLQLYCSLTNVYPLLL